MADRRLLLLKTQLKSSKSSWNRLPDSNKYLRSAKKSFELISLFFHRVFEPWVISQTKAYESPCNVISGRPRFETTTKQCMAIYKQVEQIVHFWRILLVLSTFYSGITFFWVLSVTYVGCKKIPSLKHIFSPSFLTTSRHNYKEMYGRPRARPNRSAPPTRWLPWQVCKTTAHALARSIRELVMTIKKIRRALAGPWTPDNFVKGKKLWKGLSFLKKKIKFSIKMPPITVWTLLQIVWT